MDYYLDGNYECRRPCASRRVGQQCYASKQECEQNELELAEPVQLEPFQWVRSIGGAMKRKSKRKPKRKTKKRKTKKRKTKKRKTKKRKTKKRSTRR